MTSRPPIALVKRGAQLYISNIIDPHNGEPDSGLLRVMFIGQGKPHQAYLGLSLIHISEPTRPCH
jgi:hypothetical protein